MPVPTPGCCDGPNETLRNILLGLGSISDDLANGDVFGPASSVNNDIVTFDGVTGKLIKDSGVAISSIVTTTTLKSGSQDIGSGVSTISVVFAPAFSGVPTSIVATMSRPVAEDLIAINIDEASITAAGFTATLSGTTASANYKMKWMANL